MSERFVSDVDSDLLSLPRIDPAGLSPAKAKYYARYELALLSVLRGRSVRAAAKLLRVRKNTLDAIVAEMPRMHPDGKPVGFRACLPKRRRVRPTLPEPDSLPGAPPRSVAELLDRVPDAARMVESFRGRLPERNHPSAGFERFFKRLKKAVDSAGFAGLPMWESADRGRRALIRRIRGIRQFLPAPNADEEPLGSEHATRLEHLFVLSPLDRVEGDEHKTDNKWRVVVPDPVLGWRTRAVSQIQVAFLIDVVTRAILGWRAIVGRRWTQFDLLRLLATHLTPWRPRDLVVPKLRYHADAWMPCAVSQSAEIARVASFALDNAMSHWAHNVSGNLAKCGRGITNLGFPGVPEGRSIVESLLKKLENALFRLMAGGFRPAGASREDEEATTAKRPEDFPLQMRALEDLLDVVVTTYNVTGQPILDDRSPRQVYEGYFNMVIPATSSLTAQDKRGLTTIRARVTVRGKRSERQPYVHWKHAIYRSQTLFNHYEVLNRSYDATLDADDPRLMYLWDEGQLIAILHAQGPWALSPHTIETRERATACRKKHLIDWSPYGDAVDAYEDYVRQHASEYQWAAEEYMRLSLENSISASARPPSHARTRSPIFDLPPRRH